VNNVLEPIKYKGKNQTVFDVIGEHNGFPKVEAGHKDKL
jgi:DNA (cytosine-5)-methyltransferase 1